MTCTGAEFGAVKRVGVDVLDRRSGAVIVAASLKVGDLVVHVDHGIGELEDGGGHDSRDAFGVNAEH